MGNTNTQSKTYMKDFKKQFKKKEVLKQISLGNIVIYQDIKDSNQLVFQKQIMAKSEQEHQFLTDSSMKRNLINHENLLKLYAYETKLSGHSCTTLNKITIYGEYYQKTLDMEINERYKNNQFLTEQDLWLIFYQIIQGTLCLSQFSLFIDDLRPATLFLTNEGTIKIAVIKYFETLMDRSIILGSPGSYMLAAEQQANVLLAPEQLNSLIQKEAKPKYDQNKVDIFQIGMTLLIASSLSSPEIFYDYLRHSLKFQNIDEQFQKVLKLHQKIFVDPTTLFLIFLQFSFSTNLRRSE